MGFLEFDVASTSWVIAGLVAVEFDVLFDIVNSPYQFTVYPSSSPSSLVWLSWVSAKLQKCISPPYSFITIK